MADPKQPSTAVFVSYSHQDKKWLERLQVHLKPLLRDGDIDLWDDTRIQPGDHWKREIDAALSKAQCAVFLVSPDFLSSDFIHDEELPPLLAAAEQRGTRILPVILSHCLYAESKLARFQAINDPSKPLQGLTPVKRDKVLRDLARTIAATDASQGPPPDPPSAGGTANTRRGTGAPVHPRNKHPGETEASPAPMSMLLGFGAVLLLFLLGVFVFAADTLPAYKQPIVALVAALLAGLCGWVLSGSISLHIEALQSRIGNIAVRATGGIALFVLVLMWWPPAPSTVDPGPDPSPTLQTLAGNIRDTRGDPIDGVQVSLPNFGRTVLSDAQGHFTLEASAPHQASVELMARKTGYQTHEQYATLGNTRLDFTLEGSPQ